MDETELQPKKDDSLIAANRLTGRRKSLVIAIVVCVALLAIYYLRPIETPFGQAVRLIQEHKAAQALPILEALSRQNPDNANIFPWLAQAYLATDRIAEGRTSLDTSLRLKLPAATVTPVVLAYANYYESKQDFEEAVRLFQSAAPVCGEKELVDGKARLYLKWSDSDENSALPEQALAHLEQAAKFGPHLDQSLQSTISHRLSQCYRQLAALAETKGENDTEAIRLLTKSLEVNDEPATRMALAEILARNDRSDEALANYEKVVQADSNNLEARHRLIDLLCDAENYSKAQEALLELTDKEKSVENYQLLASLDLKLGNYAGAVRAYEDACDLRVKPEILQQLENVLLDWSSVLTKERKFQEAISVRGHAERVAEQLSMLATDEGDKEDGTESDIKNWSPKVPPVGLSISRNWLARGSLTPEGEINITNITGSPISDLTLTAVFYDNTARRANGSVQLPVASPSSPPFLAKESRSLYFSCPTIVKPDHQLAVIIFWKGHFLKEFPVVKQH